MAERAERDVVLEVEGLTKRFPGVLANDNVNLKLHQGEILALLGENGAGKSTLMNMIYGLYHADEGSVRLKGREVRFASPREAIHSGIGMVHQHFQLVNVMTVAENVMLGEEAGVAYQGEDRPWLRWILRYLPSLITGLFIVLIGTVLTSWGQAWYALGDVLGYRGGVVSAADWEPVWEEWRYFLATLAVAPVAGLLVAFPPWARILWGVAWRVALIFISIWVAARIGLMTKMAFTDLALRQKVPLTSTRSEAIDDGYIAQAEDLMALSNYCALFPCWEPGGNRLAYAAGYTRALLDRLPATTYGVKRGDVAIDRINFHWRDEATGTDTEGLIASAKAQLEPYRDDGVPGWMLDGIEDAPPLAEAISVALLLFLFGWHGLRSWRGTHELPRNFESYDLGLLGLLGLAYVAFTYLSLVGLVAVGLRLVLFGLVVAGLGPIVWHTYRQRTATDGEYLGSLSPFDGALDALVGFLQTVNQINNVELAARRVRELSQQYGLEVDPGAMVEKLPVGAQQRVEIIKALYRKADILILDEPTAVLTPQEGRELFKIMRELAAQGVSIIFITHKLKEVFEVATNIVVMRDGRVVGTTTPEQATETSLAAMMVGREVILQVEKGPAHPSGPVLQVDDLEAYNDRGAKALQDVGFHVEAGEVLGIAGVQGNGQTELVEVLTGLRDATGGSVLLRGQELQPDVQPDASWSRRLGAFAIDVVLAAVLSYLVIALAQYFDEGIFSGAVARQAAIAAGLAIATTGVYFFMSWSIAGSSFGMSLFGQKLVNRQDRKPSLVRINGRYIWAALLGFVVLLTGVTLVFSADVATTVWNVIASIVLLGVVLFSAGVVGLQSVFMLLPDLSWFRHNLGLRVIRRERITPRRIKNMDSSHVPEDRQRHGMVAAYSVADNLVLDDYYERPFAQEPDAAELPLALLRYALVFGLIVGVLTGAAVYAWEHGLWEGLLDLYNVPEDMRSYSIQFDLRSEQKPVLRMPFVVSIVLFLVAEIVFGLIAHGVTAFMFSRGAVQGAFRQMDEGVRRIGWRLRGHAGEPPPPEGGLLRDEDAITQNGARLIKEFDIRTPSTETAAGNLSGGNQQKMIVAREFGRRPRLLIAAQPTRGIDVGSIEFIHQQIIEQRDAGAAVLLVSAELDEIMALSDRIAVMYKGEIIDTLPAGVASREQLGLLMAGVRDGAPSPVTSEA
jgi:ABC-type uncharacterized transport system ATPase subunit